MDRPELTGRSYPEDIVQPSSTGSVSAVVAPGCHTAPCEVLSILPVRDFFSSTLYITLCSGTFVIYKIMTLFIVIFF